MPDDLSAHLKALREAAGLSLEDVCQATKIQARFVRALEEGRWSELPSNTHLRAFSVAMAQACGADGKATAAQVQALLGASSPAKPPRGFDTPAPRPAASMALPAPSPLGGGLPRLAADGPALPAAPASSLAAASARLRSLPLAALLGLLAMAGALSYSAAWGMEQWRSRRAQSLLNAEAAPAAAVPGAAANPSVPASAAAVAGSLADAAGAEAAPAPAIGLTLRARRPCWLVLEIDGQRLPTVTMKDGDKLNWGVHQRAVMLAGNVGALRVWWRGDNLGYLGELGHRSNAIVFDPGREPRYDKAAALKLPPGVVD